MQQTDRWKAQVQSGKLWKHTKTTQGTQRDFGLDKNQKPMIIFFGLGKLAFLFFKSAKIKMEKIKRN